MWFKNLHIYQLPADFKIVHEDFLNKLAQRAFRPCAAMVDKAVGWVSPLGRDSTELVHLINGCYLICLRKEQKVIPASAIKEALEEKVYEQQEQLGRKIYRTEKLRLKDEIVSRLLPQALVKSSHIYAYFEPKNSRLLIDSASATQVDEFYQFLVDCLGNFGASPFIADVNPADILNRWLLDKPPQDFTLKGEYWLKDLKEDRLAQFKDLDGENQFVTELIKDGYSTRALGVVFDEQLSVVIKDTLQLKAIKFSESQIAENKDLGDEDPAQRFDADFVLMTSSLASLVGRLQSEFEVKASA